MIRLKYIKATNFIGFRSGLAKKTVEINLTDMLDKNMFIILGDNGTGKSTLASIIPPSHTPFGTDKTFIVEGKEGVLIREYIDDNNQIYSTKCIYLPKKDGGHNTKAYFGIYRDDVYIELNTSGNIEGYYQMIESYFKINRSLLSLTYYDDNIKSLIKMTRSERINSINKYIPANVRYNNAYNNINERYKASRNIMKNAIQKLNNHRDEKKLTQSLETLENYIGNKSSRYEDVIKKISVLENDMERLLQGRDIDTLADKVNSLSNEIKTLRVSIRALKNVNLDLDADNILKSVEKTIYENQFKIDNSPLGKMKEELYSLEESLERYESINAYSDIDIDELEKLLIKIDKDIEELNYTKNPSLYSKMSMTEIEILDKRMIEIIDQYDSIASTYSNYLLEYYKENSKFKNVKIRDVKSDILNLNNQQNIIDKEIMDVQMELSYFNGFDEVKKRINLRPKSCVDNTCAFIADAVTWVEREPEMYKLRDRLEELKVKQQSLDEQLIEYDELLNFLNDVEVLNKYLNDSEKLLDRYLGIKLSTIKKVITKGFLPDEFNFYKLREFMSILSEKELYEELVNVTKPSILNKIEIYKSKADNINLINNEINSIKKKIDKVGVQISAEQEVVKKYKEKLKKALEEKEILDSIIADNTVYTTNTKLLNDLVNDFESYDTIIRDISSIRNDLKDLKFERSYINDELTRMYKERDTTKFELIQVKDLKLDISIIEHNFIILDILKIIAQPGRGVTKETIDIFMEDIQETANVLISKTFGGRFVLLPFVIDEDTFDMPYSFNGVIGMDLSDASSAQRSIASNCISLAILSHIMNDYSIVIYDEPDSKLSSDNRADFIRILGDYTKYIGISNNFIITHSPEYYEGYDVGYILFPGFKLNNLKDVDYIKL